MAYDYQMQRPWVFTEQGQVMFLEIRDKAQALIAKAGAVRFDKLMGAGDSWNMLACVDRLVELGELREITPPNAAGQNRVFISMRAD